MGKFSYGKWAVWMGVSVFFGLWPVTVIAQPGFLSISCGAKRNHTDENNITWVTDDTYIDVGKPGYIGDSSQKAYGSSLQNLRYFPKPLNRSCYQLPLTPDVPYLLRLWFAIGNYSGFQNLPEFAVSVETTGFFTYTTGRQQSENPSGFELILVSSGSVLYICLIRTSETDDPFITAIELRTLRKGMYGQAKPGTALYILSRRDVGGNLLVRYPRDNFDRVWKSRVNLDNSSLVRLVSSEVPISSNNTGNLPPTVVMQTALVMNVDSFPITLGTTYGQKSLLLLYFAEIERLNISESRSFYVTIYGERRSDIISLLPNYSAVELTILLDETYQTYDFKFYLVKATNSNSGPIINAYEHYLLIDTDHATYSQDVEALGAIKSKFDIKDWVSDPCYVRPWDGIGCDNRSSAIRISEINLSGRNLRGSTPEDIGQLTALVTLLLDNNYLNGPLPNFSNLTMLETLHLQNNHFSGNVPDWLSELKNLKELFMDNNNFSGVIPAELVDKPSLKFRYSGNLYLCLRMHKEKCLQSIQETKNNSRKDKVKVVLKITISGALIISLALTVGIAVYWKKFRTKQPLNEDCPMIIVQNRTITGAFSLQEIMAATQNFSRKIGQGGFGSVFFGKLPQGQDIAVKVLSMFSRQGVHQFQNEVDLLSRVHHKNLVSLLGYCNESGKMMLIYEHMSGGSLRDHLYGTSEEIHQHSWKTRLKIALDAVQGLEYLHVGCTPKIIHRDVKTANILIDSNLNGKVADFGLSKITMDGEATHVTTTVKGTVGYLDPEYFRTQKLTEKSDVYSFGVVLFEIICGRPPINANLPDDHEELNLIQWATPYVEMPEFVGEIAVIIDKRLGVNYNMESITAVAKLAVRCVKARPSSRPSVSEIVAELKEAMAHENNGCLPVSEEIGDKYVELQAGAVSAGVDWSEPKDMGWSDNSSNLHQVGR